MAVQSARDVRRACLSIVFCAEAYWVLCACWLYCVALRCLALPCVALLCSDLVWSKQAGWNLAPQQMQGGGKERKGVRGSSHLYTQGPEIKEMGLELGLCLGILLAARSHLIIGRSLSWHFAGIRFAYLYVCWLFTCVI